MSNEDFQPYISAELNHDEPKQYVPDDIELSNTEITVGQLKQVLSVFDDSDTVRILLTDATRHFIGKFNTTNELQREIVGVSVANSVSDTVFITVFEDKDDEEALIV